MPGLNAKPKWKASTKPATRSSPLAAKPNSTANPMEARHSLVALPAHPHNHLWPSQPNGQSRLAHLCCPLAAADRPSGRNWSICRSQLRLSVKLPRWSGTGSSASWRTKMDTCTCTRTARARETERAMQSPAWACTFPRVMHCECELPVPISVKMNV